MKQMNVCVKFIFKTFFEGGWVSAEEGKIGYSIRNFGNWLGTISVDTFTKRVNKFIAKGLREWLQPCKVKNGKKSFIILMKDRNQQVRLLSDGDGQSLGHWPPGPNVIKLFADLIYKCLY